MYSRCLSSLVSVVEQQVHKVAKNVVAANGPAIRQFSSLSPSSSVLHRKFSESHAPCSCGCHGKHMHTRGTVKFPFLFIVEYILALVVLCAYPNV